jgi:hypothetical protein
MSPVVVGVAKYCVYQRKRHVLISASIPLWIHPTTFAHEKKTPIFAKLHVHFILYPSWREL